MQTDRIKDVVHAIHQQGEQNLKETRHSFITTPTRLSALIISLLAPPERPISWLTILKICLFLLWRLNLTFLSLLVIYGCAIGIGTLCNLAFNDWRLERPPQDQVWAIASALGIIHLSIVGTVSLVFAFELPVSYFMLLIYSLSGIVAFFVCALFGGVMLYAMWRMLKGTMGRLYWPSNGPDAPGEKDEHMTAARVESPYLAQPADRPEVLPEAAVDT